MDPNKITRFVEKVVVALEDSFLKEDFAREEAVEALHLIIMDLTEKLDNLEEGAD